MLNMIKLDWLGMKYYWVRIVVVPILICFVGFCNEAFIIPAVAYVMLSFSVNPFAVEEKGKLDNLYLTLPVTRKTIVNARFGLSLIMQAVGLVVGILVTAALPTLLYGRTIIGLAHTFKPDFAAMLLIICGSLLFYAIMNLSMFPVLFKIGYAKGKALGFYIPLGASVAIIYGVYLGCAYSDSFRKLLHSALEWSLDHTVWVSLMILAAAALVLAISYILSRKVYAKREF